jgi:sigma-B regulation protein RsbQ
MVAPLVVGHYLSEQLPGSTMRVMKATGHCPHMSHPDETIALIKEYLEPLAVSR